MSTAVSLKDLSGIGYFGFNSASLPTASMYRNNAVLSAGSSGDSTFFSSEAMSSPHNPGAGTDALSSFSSAWGLNSGNSLTSLSGTVAADPLSSALEAMYQRTLASAMMRMVTSLIGSLCGVNGLNGLSGLNNGLNNNQNNNAVDNGNLNNGGDAVEDGGNAVNNNGNNNATQQGIINEAKTWLGTPYVYGGTSRSGVDCSGFVQNVFKAKGINLPRVTTDQVKQGREVSRNQLQPGDLVFFHNNGHVGIYIGNGQYIHSPHTGDKVKISNLAGADVSACRRVL